MCGLKRLRIVSPTLHFFAGKADVPPWTTKRNESCGEILDLLNCYIFPMQSELQTRTDGIPNQTSCKCRHAYESSANDMNEQKTGIGSTDVNRTHIVMQD